MSNRRNIFVVGGIVVLGLVACFAYLGSAFLTTPHKAHAAAALLPYHATANGPYHVEGNKIVGADGKLYLFHGVGRDGLEYLCDGAGPLDRQHLAYIGVKESAEVAQQAGQQGTYWGANIVRLPLSENFWLHGSADVRCTSSHYQAVVKQAVNTLTALHLNVMLDLQWTDAGGQSGRGGAATAMPDTDSVKFWLQVAATYKTYNNVLFELFNEPHPGTSWNCWRSGCQMTNDAVPSNDCNCTKSFTYQAVGLQALVDAVRVTGATNIVIAAGINWGYDLSMLPTYSLKGTNIVYDTHPYPYKNKQPEDWDRSFGHLTATYPIISTESGEYDCGTGYMSNLLDYFDAHQMSWLTWAWTASSKTSVCSYPQLITNYQGKPSLQTGEYIYLHLQSYLPENDGDSDNLLSHLKLPF